MAGLVDNLLTRIAARLRPYLGAEGSPLEAPSPEGLPATDPLGPLNYAGDAKRWQVAADRKKRHEYRVRMDREDPVVARALDVLADVATAPEEEGDAGESFSVTCENARVQEEALRTVEALHLQKEAWRCARLLAKFGNAPYELIPDPSGTRLVRAKGLPEHEIWRRLDRYGNPLPYDPATKSAPWEQREQWRREGEGVLFEEWQIAFASFRPDDEGIYGRGVLDCERDWQRLQDIEDAMVRARQLRAYDRLLHKVPVSMAQGPDSARKALNDYARDWQQKRVLSSTDGVLRRSNPTSVEQDLFLPVPIMKTGESLGGDPGIDLLSPQNAQLNNIVDVQYMRARLLCALIVPMRYLNMGGAEAVRSAIGEGGISQEDVQFARTVRALQAAVKEAFIRALFLDLILRGLNPIQNPLSLSFPTISTADALRQANIENQRAQALKLFGEFLEMPEEMVVDYYMGLTASEKERWFGANLEKLQKKVAPPPPPVVVAPPAPVPPEAKPKPTGEALEEIAASVLVMARAYAEGGGNGRAHEEYAAHPVWR